MNDYKVISIDPVTREVTIKPPATPTKVSGLEKLVQVVVLALINRPGRSAMYPTSGAGMHDFIGQYNMAVNDPSETLGAVMERVEKIKEEILEYQNSLTNEDPSERLKDFTALSVEQGTQIDQVVVKFRLVSEAGDVANFAI